MSNAIIKLVTTAGELQQSFSVRRQVFIEEQSIAEAEEYDGLDNTALHFIARSGEQIVGTARLRFPSPEYAKIERMAVLKQFRRQGIGKRIIDRIAEELKRQSITQVVLHAQIAAMPFYRSCGFKETGGTFQEAGIEHVKMYKQL
jgi:predicted GNAT family N-acyltransferase